MMPTAWKAFLLMWKSDKKMNPNIDIIQIWVLALGCAGCLALLVLLAFAAACNDLPKDLEDERGYAIRTGKNDSKK